MLSGFELPTIFCEIDSNGLIRREDFVYRRIKHFESTGDLESWSKELEKIKNDEGVAERGDFTAWRDMLCNWILLPTSEVAFCTVSLKREHAGNTIHHCVVLMFWKKEKKLEIFDARGSDMNQYPAFPGFYNRESLRLFSKSILAEWQLMTRMVTRMDGDTLPTLDFMKQVPETFILNKDKCRTIGVSYIYTRLSTNNPDLDYRNNKVIALESIRAKFSKRTREAPAVKRRTRQKTQLRF